MKKFFICTLVFTIFLNLYSVVLNVPEEFSTIQAGIDEATNFDTVLVQPGIYYENIDYCEKEITVMSNYAFSQNVTDIDNTIIDGNQNGSVVTIFTSMDTVSVLDGFSIRNGTGTYETSHYKYRGGGAVVSGNIEFKNLKFYDNNADNGSAIYAYYFVNIDNCKFYNNQATGNGTIDIVPHYPTYFGTSWITNSDFYDNEADFGGGIFCYNYDEFNLVNCNLYNNFAHFNGGGININSGDLNLENTNIYNNVASLKGGGIYGDWVDDISFSSENRCNIYDNSSFSRGEGSDIYLTDFDNDIYVIVDTFTVDIPSDFHCHPISCFTFDILNFNDTIVDADLYVSPDGDNNNSGLTPEEPLQNIHYAQSKIAINQYVPNTIYLADGIYGSDSGENFPIQLYTGTKIVGLGDDVIIDGSDEERIFVANNAYNFHLENLTISNYENNILNIPIGCAIWIYQSNGIFENVNFEDNTLIETDVNATAELIMLQWSSMEMNNCSFQNNDIESSNKYLRLSSSYLTLNNCSFEADETINEGFVIYSVDSNIAVSECIFNDLDAVNCPLLYSENTDLAITNTVFSNIVCDHNGTDIIEIDRGNISFENTSFENVNILVGGNLIKSDNADIAISGCNFIENNINDGSLCYIYDSDVTISNTVVSANNTSDGMQNYCKLIIIENSSGTIEDLELTDNYMYAGLKLMSSDINISKALIANNYNNYNSYAIKAYSTNLILKKSTIANNRDYNSCNQPIMLQGNYAAEITNSILCDNVVEPDRIFCDERDRTSSLEITYSLIGNGYDSALNMGNVYPEIYQNNLEGDPSFVDAENGDLHLAGDSQCIDAGDPNSSFDPDGTIADIGYYYYDQTSNEEESVPVTQLALNNYPNPFNPTTEISFSIPVSGEVALKIFNVKGQLIKEWNMGNKVAGRYSIIWDGKDFQNSSVSSGQYFMQLLNEDNSIMKKMLLLK